MFTNASKLTNWSATVSTMTGRTKNAISAFGTPKTPLCNSTTRPAFAARPRPSSTSKPCSATSATLFGTAKTSIPSREFVWSAIQDPTSPEDIAAEKATTISMTVAF